MDFYSVILSGIALSATFSCLLDLALTLAPDALSAYDDFRIGGFSGVAVRRIVPACAISAVLLALILSLTPQTDILALGAASAQSLGLRVRPVRILLLSTAALASVSGLLGFVGLIRGASGGVRGKSAFDLLFSVRYAVRPVRTGGVRAV